MPVNHVGSPVFVVCGISDGVLKCLCCLVDRIAPWGWLPILVGPKFWWRVNVGPLQTKLSKIFLVYVRRPSCIVYIQSKNRR